VSEPDDRLFETVLLAPQDTSVGSAQTTRHSRPSSHVRACLNNAVLGQMRVGNPAELCLPTQDWSKVRPVWSIMLTMTIAATSVPLSEAKARLSELARRVRQQHERITLTRNGEAEAVLLSVDDLEGLEMTLEILGDIEAVARISESLAALGRGEPGVDLATVRQDLARRRATGA
jgi:antitoxin YefM